jgi:hypothetical protein
MKQKLIEIYLDWVNNFLTVARFSEYYGFTEDESKVLIELGKKYHEIQVETRKIIYG